MKGWTRRGAVLLGVAVIVLAVTPGAQAYDPGKAAAFGLRSAQDAGGGVAIGELKAPMGGTVSATNGIVTIEVEDTPALAGIGTYTWHFNGGTSGFPSPTQILYPLGTTFNTVRSVTTQTDYIQSNGGASSAYTVVSLDPWGVVAPLGPTGFRTTYTLLGPGNGTPDTLTILSDVVIHGTTWANTSVEVTTSVTNNGQAPVQIGVRYLWDATLFYDDGPTFQAISPNGAVLTAETDFAAPAFQSYVLRDNDDGVTPWPGYLAIGGTVSGPPWITPAPTVPGLLQFASWSNSVGQAFDYTSGALPISTAGLGNDAAMLYFFPSDTGSYTIAPTGTATCSASMFFQEQPAGGPFPIPAAGIAGLVAFGVLIAAGAAIALRNGGRA